MRRREFMALLGSATAGWPFAAWSQQPNRIKRVGVLMAFPEADVEGNARLNAFRLGLINGGWTEGQNLMLDVRWTGASSESMQAAAKELVGSGPDVLLAVTSNALRALTRLTNSIPIIFIQVSDPLGGGLVASLARPTGNVTGFTNFEFSIAGRWLQLLKAAVPGIRRVAFLYNPGTYPFPDAYFRAVEEASTSSEVDVDRLIVRGDAEFEEAIASWARLPNSGLVVANDISNTRNVGVIVGLAAEYRVPAIYPYRIFASNGGLLSYGFDPPAQYRDAADYANRVLRGAATTDLPVQLPSRFELVANLKTAKALGIEMPSLFLGTVDEVIE
jgi:putative tryptophan/tyrosine transport system substrate-binding protein